MLPTHYNPPAVEEELSGPCVGCIQPLFYYSDMIQLVWTSSCVECEVPRELLLHTDQLIPPI